MEQLGSIAAICLVAAVLAALLKKNGAELALLLSLAVAAAVLALLSRGVGEILSLLREMVAAAGLDEELFVPLLKTAAAALIGRIGGAMCRDAGESGLATVLETAAAFGAIFVSLPLFGAVWDMLQVLL